MSDAIPAATLVLIRDRPTAPPLLLMVERARAMVFAAGAWVFPGGRIDPSDHALAATIAPMLEDGAARVAAIRETLEETGVAIGFRTMRNEAAAIRAAIHAGAAFGDVLQQAGVTLDLDVLTPFARWRPEGRHSRIFDTRFYLARSPEDAMASVDATENVRLDWTAAADMLARADAGAATVIFPTRCNLERLARFGTMADAIVDAARYPVRTIIPRVQVRGGVERLCIPDDLGYPVTSGPLAEAFRG